MHHGTVPGDAKIGADPVNCEIVGVGPLSIDAELSLVVESRDGWNDPGREQDQGLKILPLSGRSSINVRSTTVLTVPVVGIDQRRAAFHRDGLRVGSERHLEVDFEGILDVQSHIRLDQFLEAGLFNFDAIIAGREVCQNVFAEALLGAS